LERDDRIVHIWYDHYHANSASEAERRGELFYTHFVKKKPDLKLDFFIKKEERVVHTNTIIFDAKFSKFKDIYKSDYVNETTEQLAGYYSSFVLVKVRNLEFVSIG
jgi:hypothetical protein